jgi:tetratricopeptide (TPR) repeat protein
MFRLATAAAVFAVSAMVAAGPVFAMGSEKSPEESVSEAASAIKSKDYRAAIESLEKALEQDNRNADALNYMGYSWRKLGQHDKAIKYYMQALSVDAKHKGALEYLGEAYLETKQLAKAEANLKMLAGLCNMDCAEYKELKKAVDAYKAKMGMETKS